MEAPPEKKQKTEEVETEKEEVKGSTETKDADMKVTEDRQEEKLPEPPKELEGDQPGEAAKLCIKESVVFAVQDTTLNVMQSTNGGLLMPLTDGGIQHFLAGARANVGMKSGRYMFEVKIVECITPAEEHQAYSRSPKLQSLVRVGFSLAGSPLVLGEAEECVCFDSEGIFLSSKGRASVSQRFARDEIVAVLLNLDENSPNFNTVSLFKDGVRACQPQTLPDTLRGKVLYPAVSFKSATVHVNFGKEPLSLLPFKCRMIQDASQKDVTVTPHAAPKDGKYEVVFPVGLPDEGAFEWLDAFLEKNPGYTELSDRMILAWAEKSGIWRPKGYTVRSSNDRPEMNFGIRELDDNSVQRIIRTMAPLQNRNFVVMEVKANLIKDERKELLARFASPAFKRTANVLVGEPSLEFRRKTNQLMLKQKQEASDTAFRLKKAEEKRQKLLEKRQRELEKARKKAERAKARAEKEQKKKIEEENSAREAAAKEEADEKDSDSKVAETAEIAKEGKDVTMEDQKEEKKDDAEEEKEHDDESEDEKEEEEEREEPEEEPPKVQLTAEEKKVWHVKSQTPDLAPYILSTSLTRFSLPEKDEGFEDIKYEWARDKAAKDYLKQWMSDKKLTTRVEDLVPSEWFNGKWTEWQRVLQQWHTKHTEHKGTVAKKEAAKAAKKAAEVAAPKKELPEGGEEKEAEPAPMDEEKEEEDTADFEHIDVFGVNDVMNIGGGEPLFKEFQFEDWTMMSLRFELHLLVHAFRRDVDDPERAGIHLDHLAFYYNKYYKKALSSKSYGVETFKELVDLIHDTMYVSKKQVLESQLEEEWESLQIFVKLTEEARRHRNICLALGEEGARLRLSQPSHFAPGKQGPLRGGKRGGKGQQWHSDKGKGKAVVAVAGYRQHGLPPRQDYAPRLQQPAPRTVAPRTVPPPFRQAWHSGDQGKGK